MYCHVFILLFLLLSPILVNSVGVQTPSASASSSMASNLLQTLTGEDSVVNINGEPVSEKQSRPEECRVKNLKQQEKMSMAKLDAHRCLIRDMVVEVPVPDTLIATYVHPSHIVVPRCTGLCLERPGCTCVPKKSRHITVDIVVGINSSSVDQMCSTLQIEEHRGPCRCKCLTKNCHYNKDLDKEACLCRCKPEFAALKRECATTGRLTRSWDEETCACKCKPRVCVEGHYQDSRTCDCKPVESTCSAVGVTGSESADGGGAAGNGDPAFDTSAPKYIGLTVVALMTGTLLIVLYFMVTKNRNNRLVVSNGLNSGSGPIGQNGQNGLAGLSAFNGLPHGLDAGSIASLTGTLRGRNGGHTTPGGTTAYTITINSQGASSIDEAILPLTEDKTRF